MCYDMHAEFHKPALGIQHLTIDPQHLKHTRIECCREEPGARAEEAGPAAVRAGA
jgi:hypothetical protein